MKTGLSPVLSVRKLTKIYPGTIANKDIDLYFYGGEVLALVGENGAGKSTFIKMVSGVIRPTSGEIFVRGRATTFNNPQSAFKAGISALHQELNMVSDLRVYENIFLGSEIKKSIMPEKNKMMALFSSLWVKTMISLTNQNKKL